MYVHIPSNLGDVVKGKRAPSLSLQQPEEKKFLVHDCMPAVSQLATDSLPSSGGATWLATLLQKKKLLETRKTDLNDTHYASKTFTSMLFLLKQHGDDDEEGPDTEKEISFLLITSLFGQIVSPLSTASPS